MFLKGARPRFRQPAHECHPAPWLWGDAEQIEISNEAPNGDVLGRASRSDSSLRRAETSASVSTPYSSSCRRHDARGSSEKRHRTSNVGPTDRASMSLVLPRISRVPLTGFDPIFNGRVELAPPPTAQPPVLGGYGLGKTTILEAIAFGVAGPADDVIQRDREDKRYMWGASLFRERLNHAHTEVAVRLFLGTKRLGVDVVWIQRLFGESRWTTASGSTPTLRPALYAEAIVNSGGYRGFDDFRFLVHRLSYLPESRQNIVWHAETQLRIFLLLCADGDTEARGPRTGFEARGSLQ